MYTSMWDRRQLIEGERKSYSNGLEDSHVSKSRRHTYDFVCKWLYRIRKPIFHDRDNFRTITLNTMKAPITRYLTIFKSSVTHVIAISGFARGKTTSPHIIVCYLYLFLKTGECIRA